MLSIEARSFSAEDVLRLAQGIGKGIVMQIKKFFLSDMLDTFRCRNQADIYI